MELFRTEDAADRCVATCNEFATAISSLTEGSFVHSEARDPGSFDTARQIGTVYSLFIGEDLQTLLNGYVSQVEAMAQRVAIMGVRRDAQYQPLPPTPRRVADSLAAGCCQ